MNSQQRHPDLGALNDSAPATGGVSNTFTQSSSGLFVEPSRTVDFSADSPSSSSALAFLDRTFAHITSHSHLGDRDGVQSLSLLTAGHVDCLRDSITSDRWTATKHAKTYKAFVQKDIDLHLPHLLDAAFVSTILMAQQAIEGAINTSGFYRLPNSSTLLETATLSIITDLDRIQPEVDKVFQCGAIPDYAVHILFDIPFFGSYIQHGTVIQVSGLISVAYHRAPWTESTQWSRHSDLHVKEGSWFMAAEPMNKYHFQEHPVNPIPEMHSTRHSVDSVARVDAVQEPIAEPSFGPIGWDTAVQHNTQALEVALTSISGDPLRTTETPTLFNSITSTATSGFGINNANSNTFTISNSAHHLTAATPEYCDDSWDSPLDSWSYVDQSLSQYTPRHQRGESSSSGFSCHRSQPTNEGSPGEFSTTYNTPDDPLSSPGINASDLKSLCVTTPIPIHASQAFNNNNNTNYEPTSHPGVQQRRFPCTVEGCDKSYPRKSNMQDHLLTHDDANRFPCLSPSCIRTFARERDRDRHNNVHEGWRWKCNFCCKKFTRHDSAKQHACRFANGRLLTFQYKQFANANADDSNDNNDDNNCGTNSNATNTF